MSLDEVINVSISQHLSPASGTLSDFTTLLLTLLSKTVPLWLDPLGSTWGCWQYSIWGSWNDTSWADKRLHEISWRYSAGGSERFSDNFDVECVTWSKLCHPGVVQFIGELFSLPLAASTYYGENSTSLWKTTAKSSPPPPPPPFKSACPLSVVQGLAS